GPGLLGVLQDPEADGVLALAPDVSLKPGDGLQVVVEDLGGGGQDGVDGSGVAIEVGGEDLGDGSGAPPDGEDATPDVAGAAVGQVVPGDGSDDDVLQAQSGAGLGQAVGLVDRGGLGLPPGDGAEAAGAGADLAEDHERGGLAGPALRPVG